MVPIGTPERAPESARQQLTNKGMGGQIPPQMRNIAGVRVPSDIEVADGKAREGAPCRHLLAGSGMRRKSSAFAAAWLGK